MDLLALEMMGLDFSTLKIETEKPPETSASSFDATLRKPETTKSQQQLTIDLARRLMEAAQKLTTRQTNIAALPTFCTLALDEHKARRFAQTFLEASDQCTTAADNGAAARELRDELTPILKHERQFIDTLQESRDTLIEDTMRAVESGDESEFLELYCKAQRSLSRQQTENMENTVKMLDKVQQMRRAGILPDNVKSTASPTSLCDSYGFQPINPRWRPTRNDFAGDTCSTKENATTLNIEGPAFRSQLATDLQRYASGEPEKGHSYDVHQGFIALRDDRLTDFAASCIDIIDFISNTEISSELKGLSTKLGSLSESSDDPLGDRLRKVMEKDRPESVIKCLGRASKKFDEIVGTDTAGMKQLGESLINLAAQIEGVQRQAKESKIEW